MKCAGCNKIATYECPNCGLLLCDSCANNIYNMICESCAPLLQKITKQRKINKKNKINKEIKKMIVEKNES